MQLDAAACWHRLRLARHGTLGTVHTARGVDAVPVVFVVSAGRVVMPVDTVKPKSGSVLQRLRNLRVDPRAVLLVEHYDDDWAQLWWVRLHGHAHERQPIAEELEALGEAFQPYRDAGAITSVIVLEPSQVTGWAASAR